MTIIADKGADIYEFLYKPRDVDFMWRSWVGLRDRSHFVPTSARAEAGAHMDYYEGGWQELFPNCGNLSLHQEAEIGQHGEVLLLPWRYTITKDEPDEIEVRFEVRTVRTPFHLVKTVSLRRNEAVLRIHERVTNESGQSVSFTWGHHPALGWPFIDESCRVDLPDVPDSHHRRICAHHITACAGSGFGLAFRERRRRASQVDLSQIPGPETAASDMVFLEGITGRLVCGD